VIVFDPHSDLPHNHVAYETKLFHTEILLFQTERISFATFLPVWNDRDILFHTWKHVYHFLDTLPNVGWRKGLSPFQDFADVFTICLNYNVHGVDVIFEMTHLFYLKRN